MQYHIIELLVNDQRNTIGGLTMHGSIHTLEAYNGGSEGIAIVEEYILFGDCTLPIRTADPDMISAAHDPIIPLGSTSFTVQTTPGALVGLMMDGVLYGSAIAGASGEANIEFEDALSIPGRSEEHTSELQSRRNIVCRLLLEKKNYTPFTHRSCMPSATI